MSSPRDPSSRASARRNWCPPPDGEGASSWKSARSARPRREAAQSASIRARRASSRPARRAARGTVRSSTAETVTSPAVRCPPQAVSRACSSGDGFRSAPASACFAQRCAGGSARRARMPLRYGRARSSSHTRLRGRLGVVQVGRGGRRVRRPTTRERPFSISARTRGTSARTPSRAARALVISFEPDTANLELLERAAAALQERRRGLARPLVGRRSRARRGRAAPDVRLLGALAPSAGHLGAVRGRHRPRAGRGDGGRPRGSRVRSAGRAWSSR